MSNHKQALLVALALLLNGSCLDVRAQTPALPSPILLEVTWTVESRVVDAGLIQIVLEGSYEVEWTHHPISGRPGARACTGYEVDIPSLKDGETFCFRLKLLSGRLVKGEGVFSGEKVIFKDAPAGESRGGWPDGMVESRADGSAEVKLEKMPDFQGSSGPYEEATGCWQGGWPSLTLTYGEVRNLAKLQKRWTGPSFTDEMKEMCAGNATVEIRGKAGAPVPAAKGTPAPEPKKPAAPARPALAIEKLLMPADIEKVTGLTGVKLLPQQAVWKRDFARADGAQLLLVTLGDATTYSEWRKQEGVKTAVSGVGDEAFEQSLLGAEGAVLFFRKGGRAVSLSSYFDPKLIPEGKMKPLLTSEQLRALAKIIVSRL